MADLNTGGALVLSRPWFRAAAVASTYAVALEGPPSGTMQPSLAVPLTMFVSSSTGLLTDVAVQVATDSGFTAVVYSNTLTGRENGLHSVTVSALADKTTYYWRARAAETGTTGWAPWTAAWTFTPDLNSGKGFLYSDQNVGATPAPSSVWAWYSDFNVGVEVTLKSVWPWYSQFNVGVEVTVKALAFGYVHYGNVNSLTPTPHLWWLSPPAGRAGDGMRIFCFGVGDLASTFGAVVEVNYGGNRGWQAVQVTGWQTYPPGVNAYTAARKLDPGLEYIDMQHTIVEITVPADALPPGYPIRIRTEGP